MQVVLCETIRTGQVPQTNELSNVSEHAARNTNLGRLPTKNNRNQWHEICNVLGITSTYHGHKFRLAAAIIMHQVSLKKSAMLLAQLRDEIIYYE